MEFEEIARLAYQGAPLPRYTAQEDQWAYLSLRCLYREYLNKFISKEQAQGEKADIQKTFEAAKAKHEREFAYQKHLNDLKVRIGAIAKEMVLSECPLCRKAMAIIDGRARDDPQNL